MSESASPLASPAPEEATIQKKAPRSRSSRSTGKKEVKEKKKITAKKPVYKKPVEEKSATHPSWKDIIKVCLLLSLSLTSGHNWLWQECIAANPEDARSGVSRSTLKKVCHYLPQHSCALHLMSIVRSSQRINTILT